jgi:hypothetical protein
MGSSDRTKLMALQTTRTPGRPPREARDLVRAAGDTTHLMTRERIS